MEVPDIIGLQDRLHFHHDHFVVIHQEQVRFHMLAVPAAPCPLINLIHIDPPLLKKLQKAALREGLHQLSPLAVEQSRHFVYLLVRLFGKRSVRLSKYSTGTIDTVLKMDYINNKYTKCSRRTLSKEIEQRAKLNKF